MILGEGGETPPSALALIGEGGMTPPHTHTHTHTSTSQLGYISYSWRAILTTSLRSSTRTPGQNIEISLLLCNQVVRTIITKAYQDFQVVSSHTVIHTGFCVELDEMVRRLVWLEMASNV